MTDDPYRHVRPDDDDEPRVFPDEAIEVPGFAGMQGFLVDIQDPDAIEKMRTKMEESIAEARAMLEKVEAGQRDMMMRAAQPGYFDWFLDTFAGSMHASTKAEFIAQAALDRRISQLEKLVSERLVDFDLGGLEEPT